MKLGLRIFAWYLLIFLLCFSYPIGWVLDNVRTRYLENVEDPLVDQANILAEWVGYQMEKGSFAPEEMQAIFQRAYSRQVNSNIYSLVKKKVDIQIYITDAIGQVVFDSQMPENVGADYTHWRDVSLTLEGRYGARTSLADPEDPTSSVLYVAAPVNVEGRLAGVLTVAKPTTNINRFIRAAKPRFLAVVATAAALAIILSYIAALAVARPIKRLTEYANAVRSGKQAPFPSLDRTEIGDMGKAFQLMQATLEGKTYVEEYVQKLTHEVKSPLSAIRGAAELLGEEMPQDRRHLFLSNIRIEADRIQAIVDRMLELAALEFKQHLSRRKRVNIQALVKTVVESKQPMLMGKHLSTAVDIGPGAMVHGDPFLLHQALSNLVQNAIDFSTPETTIRIYAHAEEGQLGLRVENRGPSIPDYARKKIFDKFFSLQRPDSGQKSTGLGLNLVKQVVQLHQGSIRLENRSTGGVRAILTLPAKRK